MIFFIFYWVAALMTFDDDQEEVIELVDSLFFLFFRSLDFLFCSQACFTLFFIPRRFGLRRER
jgi:hypothetical protein